MAKQRILLLAAIFVLEAVMAGWHPANASTDSRVNELFTALRDGKFAKATEHFDPTMKAALSADQLSTVWLQIVADKGKLEKWKIVRRGQMAGIEVVGVVLTFEHGKLLSTVSVRPESDEIAGLYFKPALTASTGSSQATSPPYADAAKFRSEMVTVGADSWKLPGILTIPVGSGPFPAVVLLAGSGPNDRDETVGANHVFKDLAEGLSSRGIIVLRYDKRTYAYRTLNPQKVTVDEEVIQDGVAAVRMLRARAEVARGRIFVVGHSLGAMMAPEVAKKAWPVAGIVMLAPAGRKLPAVIVQQMRYLGEASPKELAELKREANEISAHRMPATQYFFGAPASYYYDLDARDEVAIARSLDVPILILHGSRDYQVIDEDIRNWQNGLKGDAKVQVDMFPGLNHLFVAGAGKPGPAEYNTPGHVDVAVIATIASFVSNAGNAH
ncbi:alpha/beta fold hydrolase [Candidatus Binatus sp.]|jgi:dienelactone hydrolase|uniref:alpha/beta fold hydrolase n=1 Tax=Candidatus Binatus sp. TaxID=2811406 RepID=UPI003BE12BB2